MRRITTVAGLIAMASARAPAVERTGAPPTARQAAPLWIDPESNARELTDPQWSGAFRAGGFDRETTDRHVARIREKIDEGTRLG
jgi:hypothetical protein